MPNPSQLQEVFKALVGNGLDFFERATKELSAEQKFSIAHFATGLELLLKARLFHEHWTLIAVEPHCSAWSTVKDGTVRTLQASDLCAAITTTTGTALTHESRAFKAIFDHRNRVLHWAPTDDLASTVAEQCLAWYHLRALLTGSWKDAFAPFRVRIDKVERQLRAHRTYLEVRFRLIEPTLRGPESSGLLLACPACEFRAGVVDGGAGRVQPFECRVCGYTATAFRANNGAFEHRDRQQMLDELDPIPNLKPKEMSTYEPDRGYCGECFDNEVSVALDGVDYVCVGCGARFEPADSSNCEWCNGRWFGWDAEGSYYGGCEHCDGHGMDRD
jgi:hypothetical protein